MFYRGFPKFLGVTHFKFSAHHVATPSPGLCEGKLWTSAAFHGQLETPRALALGISWWLQRCEVQPQRVKCQSSASGEPPIITGHFRNRLIGGTDSIYKAYFLGLCKGISPQNMASKMVQYLHFRILKISHWHQHGTVSLCFRARARTGTPSMSQNSCSLNIRSQCENSLLMSMAHQAPRKSTSDLGFSSLYNTNNLVAVFFG